MLHRGCGDCQYGLGQGRASRHPRHHFCKRRFEPYGGNAGDGGPIAVVNQGAVAGNFAGIVATVAGNNSTLTIVNEGMVDATGIFAATGLETFTSCGCGIPIFNPSGYGDNSPLTIINSGTIDPDVGITALTFGDNSPIGIENSGKVEATFLGIAALTYAAKVRLPSSIAER
jgi:hypothetical protein